MAPVFADAWSGKVSGDTAKLYLPFKSVALEALHSGQVPLWNPYLFSGAPLLADPQTSLLYPSQILFLFLPLPLAFAITQFLHVTILAFGTYLLLRLYCNSLPALAGALAFALSGPVFLRVGAGIYSTVQVVAWLPWLFLCLELYWIRHQPLWMIVAGVVLALQLLAGFPTLVVYTLFAVGIYLLYRTLSALRHQGWKAALRATSLAGLMVVVAVTLSAAQCLPTLEFLSLATRATPDYSFVRQNSFPLYNLITSVLPEIFGSTLTGTAIQKAYWGEHSIYVGGLPVLLAALYVSRIRDHLEDGSVVYLLLAGAMLLLALGAYNPAYNLLFAYVPGFRALADPGRSTILIGFFVSLVAAVSLQQLASWLPQASKRFRRSYGWFAIAVSGCLVGVLCVLTWGQDILTAIARPMIHERYGIEAAAKMEELDTLYMTQAFTVIIFLVVMVAGSVAIYLRLLSRLSERAFVALCLLIITLDVGLFSARLCGMNLMRTSLESYDSVTKVPQFVTVFSGEAGRYRVLPLKAMAIINQGSQFRIPSITGFNSLIVSCYARFLGVARGMPVESGDRVPVVTSYQSRLLRLLNVRYLISHERLTDVEAKGVQVGDVTVYDLGVPDNHAFMVYRTEYFDSEEKVAVRMAEPSFDPARVVLLETRGMGQIRDAPPVVAEGEWWARVMESTLNSLTIEAYTSAPGWLVVSEIYYPGWKVYVSGRERPAVKADLALRAIELGVGRHRVELRYEPRSFWYGLGISATSAIAVVCAIVGVRQRQRRLRMR